jgi:curli biogenesis system outer membrane secretion channel CsgG
MVAAAALGASPLAREVAAQQQPKKVLVIDFDQQQVQGGLREIFGRENVNVGRSLARLVAARLAQNGLQIVEASGAIPFTIDPAAATAAGRAAGADAVVAGTVLVYGSGSGTAGVGGPRIGGIRLNVGRRTTIAVVGLEARLIDVASGTLLGVVPASAQGSRSGLAITVSVPNIVDASGLIDMTRDDFRSTLIGQFTEESVGQLVTGVAEMRGRIGAVSVAPVVAAAPVAAAPMAAAMPSGPVVYPSGPFAWAPYRFRGAEHFRYQVQQREDGQNTEGFYQLDLQPAGAGQARMTVQGQVGTSSFQTSVTMPVGEGGISGPQMMMTFMPLASSGPLFIALFNPAAWIMFGGRQLAIGDGWQNSQGGESMSVRVESQCTYGGQGGLLVVFRENDQVRQESCISPNVALPLRALLVEHNGDRVEMILTEYRP